MRAADGAWEAHLAIPGAGRLKIVRFHTRARMAHRAGAGCRARSGVRRADRIAAGRTRARSPGARATISACAAWCCACGRCIRRRAWCTPIRSIPNWKRPPAIRARRKRESEVDLAAASLCGHGGGSADRRDRCAGPRRRQRSAARSRCRKRSSCNRWRAPRSKSAAISWPNAAPIAPRQPSQRRTIAAGDILLGNRAHRSARLRAATRAAARARRRTPRRAPARCADDGAAGRLFPRSRRVSRLPHRRARNLLRRAQSTKPISPPTRCGARRCALNMAAPPMRAARWKKRSAQLGASVGRKARRKSASGN